MILYLIPGYDKPCPVGTEYGIRSVFKITFRIIADFPHNFLCIMADIIPFQRAEHSAKSAGICRKLFLITAHFRYRGTACKNCQAHEAERLDVMVDILTKDPTAFTANDMIDPEEYVSISKFAMLTTSVDATPFEVEPRDQQQNPVAKLLSKKVVVQAVRTVMSAACENLKGSTPDTFEEMAENSVAKEFEVVLDTIVTHFKDK